MNTVIQHGILTAALGALLVSFPAQAGVPTPPSPKPCYIMFHDLDGACPTRRGETPATKNTTIRLETDEMTDAFEPGFLVLTSRESGNCFPHRLKCNDGNLYMQPGNTWFNSADTVPSFPTMRNDGVYPVGRNCRVCRLEDAPPPPPPAACKVRFYNQDHDSDCATPLTTVDKTYAAGSLPADTLIVRTDAYFNNGPPSCDSVTVRFFNGTCRTDGQIQSGAGYPVTINYDPATKINHIRAVYERCQNCGGASPPDPRDRAMRDCRGNAGGTSLAGQTIVANWPGTPKGVCNNLIGSVNLDGSLNALAFMSATPPEYAQRWESRDDQIHLALYGVSYCGQFHRPGEPPTVFNQSNCAIIRFDSARCNHAQGVGVWGNYVGRIDCGHNH